MIPRPFKRKLERQTALAPGTNLGAYRIIEPLGKGGMAAVYKAYEAALDRYVAIKVLPGEFLHDETFAGRFEREANRAGTTCAWK
jgi:serine/threonine protein kinase